MNECLQVFPPGRIWIPVCDLASALRALEQLQAHCIHCAAAAVRADRDDI